MEILLSFTGFHDPFAESSLENVEQGGPILSILAERRFDKVCLFQTPKLAGRTMATREAILERSPTTSVEVLEVPLADPTNHLGILRQVRRHFSSIKRRHPDALYSISVSSGTPHMHATWILLAASGEIPAVILQSTPPQFLPEGEPRVKEIDLTAGDFPQITRPLACDSEIVLDETSTINAACRELGVIGEDPAFLKALRQSYIYSQYDDTNVLLLGETGSGKEYLARFIHLCSGRSTRPLVTVNCGGIPESLVETHLFGHRKGSFTGAITHSEGKFKSADRGVIFLDELGELPLNAQAKLLRVLEQGEIESVGAARPERVDVKVIAATNRDLRTMVDEGTFREDLYQRFGSRVAIPALRDRRLDISRLAVHVLDRWNATHKRQQRLTPQAIRALASYLWPGNVRELANVIRESAMLASGQVISPEDLAFGPPATTRCRSTLIPEPSEGFEMPAFLDETKEKLIDRALELSGQVQSRAARLLGVTPQAISQHLKRKELKQALQQPSTRV